MNKQCILLLAIVALTAAVPSSRTGSGVLENRR
jgi:hypothetical protein